MKGAQFVNHIKLNKRKMYVVFLIFIRRKIYAYAHRKSGIPALDEIEQYLEVCRYIYNIMLFC